MSTISRESNEQTPLQSWLNKLTSAIGKIVRYFTGNTKDENGNTKVDDIIISVVGIVAAAVTIVVVVIPEVLPLAVTLTLAYSMKRMMADRAMVRKLSAYETMGSATDICTVKMGTLTLNQMQGTKFWLGRESMQERSSTSISDNILELLHQGVCLNTTGSVYKSTSGSEFEFFCRLLKSSGSAEYLFTLSLVTMFSLLRAIAIECGILKPNQEMNSEAAVDGDEFGNYTPVVRLEKVDKNCVMARSSPFNKLLMVQCLKQKGHVVAVTGDGTNDAPTLKEADIGLSMGILGTEVARESSDIFILDDNFGFVATVLM